MQKKSNKTSKTSKTSKTTSFDKSKMSKKSICVKKNMDYNPNTRRCNKKCKPNETRNNKFKCVKIS